MSLRGGARSSVHAGSNAKAPDRSAEETGRAKQAYGRTMKTRSLGVLHAAAGLRLLSLVGLGLAGGCASVGGHPVATTAAMPEGAPREPLAWAEFSPQTFARAKAERKFIIMDGSAEWCHWCHVMEATTYHDPAVREILDRSFIAVKVDVDSRPDLEERYGAWGWPATVVFSPDAEELGKYRGYIAPEDFAGLLKDVVENGAKVAEEARAKAARPNATGPIPAHAMSEETLDYIERSVIAELDDLYDAKLGGWGYTQKAPIAWDNAWALERAKAGDAKRREQALFTLEAQKAILDPVWGGIYQYSTNGDWNHAHFEKLMPFEAGALDNYASAYLLTGDPKQLETARSVQRYLESFLHGPQGGFFPTQDADLNAHDPSKPFLSGHDYYAKDDAHRRALGVPRVDTHEYARDNGLAIAAYVTLYEATCKKGPCDEGVLATAERAAQRILATHTSPGKAGVTHDEGASADTPRHLGDNAYFAWGLARLYEATKKPEYAKLATSLADFLCKDLADAEGGGFFESPADPGATGVFARRRVPFEENVMAIRVLAKLAHALPETRESYGRAIDRALRRVSEPSEIKQRGRMIGDFVLALEETRGVRGVP